MNFDKAVSVFCISTAAIAAVGLYYMRKLAPVKTNVYVGNYYNLDAEYVDSHMKKYEKRLGEQPAPVESLEDTFRENLIRGNHKVLDMNPLRTELRVGGYVQAPSIPTVKRRLT